VSVFTVGVSYNRYRLPGDTRIDAIVTVTASAAAKWVMLRIFVPENVSVRYMRQVTPTVKDLMPPHPLRRGQRADIGTGLWSGGESREYYLLLDVPADDNGREMVAARLRLVPDMFMVTDVHLLGEARVAVSWAGDPMLALEMDPHVARFTEQEKLARTIHAAREALEQGDLDTAGHLFAQALALAREQLDDGTPAVRLLARMTRELAAGSRPAAPD
jgi:hypothetical protein